MPQFINKMEFNTKREFYINFDHEQDHSIEYLYGILNDTRTTTLLTVRNFLTYVGVPTLTDCQLCE